MKSLMLLWQKMAADAAIQCRTSADRDIERITARFEHEGLELITLGLPEIGKEFESSLDQGQITPAMLTLCGSHKGFPIFLRGFLELVFDRKCGLLLDDPSVTAIQALRQLLLSFSKVGLPCSDARETQAFTDFVKCEQELRHAIFAPSSAEYREFAWIATLLFGGVFHKIDRDVYWGNILPKHGPGATADKLTGNGKYRQIEWTDRLEEVFPAMDYLLPSYRYYQSLSELKYLDPGSERPVKVISVPKTQKTPRIIAIEPTCMQYVQQGLMEKFVEYLEADKCVVSGFVGFSDQTPNQRLAQAGSLSGDLATLDLSEASDRVSCKLVTEMLCDYPHLLEAVLASRSTRADVPGHGIIPLSKFASMGSALTFPIEEIVFLTAIFYGIKQSFGGHFPQGIIEQLEGRVRVYGDDIIIPVDFVQHVIATLELFGFKVNARKSFWTGKFRESCGKEFYDGEDVTIFRVRHTLPTSRADAPGVISTVSLRNQAYLAGYWQVARYLDEVIEGLKLPFPNVLETSPVLGRRTFLGYDSEQRMHPYLQIPLVKGMLVRTQIPSSPLEDEYALLKCFLKRGDQPFADARHLERQGRPRVVGMKLGWACPY